LKTDVVARTASADVPLAALTTRKVPKGKSTSSCRFKASLISSKIKFTIFLAAL